MILETLQYPPWCHSGRAGIKRACAYWQERGRRRPGCQRPRDDTCALITIHGNLALFRDEPLGHVRFTLVRPAQPVPRPVGVRRRMLVALRMRRESVHIETWDRSVSSTRRARLTSQTGLSGRASRLYNQPIDCAAYMSCRADVCGPRRRKADFTGCRSW